jgi:soluble lytic murein transglycosylase-like protein
VTFLDEMIAEIHDDASDKQLREIRRSHRRIYRRAVWRAVIFWTVLNFLAAAVLGWVISAWLTSAHAATPAKRVQAAQVPPQWRIAIERQGARYFGLKAQPARMAAQIHQESAWKPRAASAFAQGLTQFTPATARWVPSICPEIGPPDVWNPTWAIGAQHCYMAWLHRRVPPLPGDFELTDCDRWAFALRAYNGGEGWLLRERRAARKAGANANAWRAVEPFRARAGWAHTENIEYPQRILLRIEPAYLAAGWPGGPACR